MTNSAVKLKLQGLIDCARKHTPEILTAAGLASALTTVFTNWDPVIRYKSLYKATGSEYHKIRYMQVAHSNNWMKMHGYPIVRIK